MAQPLRKFVARAPRYLLRPDDNRMMRFAADNEQHRTYSTQFYNVSESGLAFIVDRKSAPRVGDLIKLEFSIPGGDQIAWFAKVVRIEEHQVAPWWSERRDREEVRDVLIGVTFQALPEGHRRAIRQHLQTRFQEVVRENKRRRLRHLALFIAEHGWQLVVYAIAALLTFSMLYLLSRPGPNYDPQKGAPWGQRFKFGSGE